MRALIALALAAVLVMACGGGASSPVKVPPGVTSAPNAPGGPATSSAPYDYGY